MRNGDNFVSRADVKYLESKNERVGPRITPDYATTQSRAEFALERLRVRAKNVHATPDDVSESRDKLAFVICESAHQCVEWDLHGR